MEKHKTYKEIELRAEEVQEIMNKPPSWIQRWGIALMLFIIITLLIGSYLIKYPDTIVTEILITTSNPPVEIIARSTGKIDEIFVSNNLRVGKNTKLAVLQNTAKTDDMLLLAQHLECWKEHQYDLSMTDSLFSFLSLSLGSVQVSYSTFISNLSKLQHFLKQNYYAQKISLLAEKNDKLNDYYGIIIRQKQLANEQLNSTQTIFEDSVLLNKKSTTGNLYDSTRINLFKNNQTYLTSEATIKQIDVQLVAEREELLELKNQLAEMDYTYRLALQNSAEQLQAVIKEWESNYLFVSPVDGIVNNMGVWSNYQNVVAGQTVFTIVPFEKGDFKGRALLPVKGAGKVKIGQRVNIRITNFPDQQYGYLIGSISSISNTANSDGFYILEVAFPAGLTTNYHIKLPTSQQMVGTAEIVTEELKVIERFFQPIKQFFYAHN